MSLRVLHSPLAPLMLFLLALLWLLASEARGQATRPAATRPSLDPPGARDFVHERRRMVEAQIARPRDGRDRVTDPQVLEAMRAVPRHAFVPENSRRVAYTDGPLPIGEGQTISQPYVVALMTQHLRVTPESRILEVGTGSGYQAAVLAHLTPHVYSIEIVKPLADQAARTLREQGYTDVKLRHGDGYLGWPEAAPFDGIIVTCAADDIPEPLWQQLKPGGRMVIPTGDRIVQRLIVVTKNEDGSKESRTITGVRFVPLVRTRPE